MPLNIYQEDIIHDPTVDIKFITQGMDQHELVALYNCADALISYSTAEGFGLSSA
jgi:trehalose-6-phosphate synthase